MQTAATFSFLRHLALLPLAGPILDKEVRMASRRVCNYVLRAAYVLLLGVFTVSAWYHVVGLRGTATGVFAASRAPEIGRHVASQIIWFQLAAAQLIAAVMLSSSIGDEMRRGTLSLLMTTPICSAQIVVGKLLSGLLQVVLLLAISLPVLAILRVLGGVPWGFVLAGFCITLTASVFAGALSLLLSTYYRHSYDVISAGIVVYLLMLAIVPAVAAALVSTGKLSQPLSSGILGLINPFRTLYLVDSRAWPAGPPAGRPLFSWPVHCLTMAVVTAAIVSASIGRIRRANLAGLSARAGRSDCPAGPKKQNLCRGWRRSDIVAGVVALAVCALAIAADATGMGAYGAYLYYFSWGFWMVALLRLAVSAAGGITREKESGTWPVLLATPLDDDRILRVKAYAALRSNIVLLLSATAVQVCFMLCESASPKALSFALCVLSAAASVFFITTAGLYFGTRLRGTTTAVVATLGAYLCLNYIVCGRHNPLFGWLLWKIASKGGTGSAPFMLLAFGMGTATFVLDTALGMVLVRRALRNLRRRIF